MMKWKGSEGAIIVGLITKTSQKVRDSSILKTIMNAIEKLVSSDFKMDNVQN